MPARIDAFLELLIKQRGSDLHLVTGQPPRIRVHGQVEKIHFRELEAEDLGRMLAEILSERQRQELEQRRAIDFAYETEALGRFRVNAYQHTRGPGAAFVPSPGRSPPWKSWASLRSWPRSSASRAG